jgi:hypothetical protein
MKILELIRNLFTTTKTVYSELDDFDSEYQLGLWYESNKGLQLSGKNNMCDDFAREARELARKDGKYLGIALVWEGMIYNTPVFPDPINSSVGDKTIFHVGNLAVCKKENTCWYVDLAFNKIIKLCNFYPGGKY